MVFHVNISNAPTRDLGGGGNRGTTFELVDQARGGSERIDFHLNVIKPGTPDGPYHYHSRADNVYFVLEGRARLLVEGSVLEAGPGEAVFIPAGEKHGVTNIGDGELRLIEVKAPAESDYIVVPPPDS